VLVGTEETKPITTKSNIHHSVNIKVLQHKINITRMWANAQRDGRPAKHTVGGDLCSTPQSLADAHYLIAVQ